MSHGKVCCNCNHCIRSRDDKYNIIICRCDVHDMYLSYASVMGGCCKHWTKKQEGEETGGRVMNETVIRLSDYERTCRNCVYLDEDSCSCPNGWFLDDRNRCEQFKRKQKQEGE